MVDLKSLTPEQLAAAQEDVNAMAALAHAWWAMAVGIESRVALGAGLTLVCAVTETLPLDLRVEVLSTLREVCDRMEAHIEERRNLQ